jgi:hypothetical protein
MAPTSCGKCGSRIPEGNDGPCPVCEDSPFGKPTYAEAPQHVYAETPQADDDPKNDLPSDTDSV